jgi:hypothetical protein
MRKRDLVWPRQLRMILMARARGNYHPIIWLSYKYGKGHVKT